MKVIGISGTIGSGKNEVKEIIKEKFSCYCVTISDVIRAEVERRKGMLDRKTLQDMGNEMRQKYGPHILAMLTVEYLPRDKELIIVDGIRNPGEGDYLRKKFGRNFLWLGVDAPKEIRFQRASERKQHSDPNGMEEFQKLDERDQGAGESEFGQQTRKCIDECSQVIINDGTMDDLRNKVNTVLNNFIGQ